MELHDLYCAITTKDAPFAALEKRLLSTQMRISILESLQTFLVDSTGESIMLHSAAEEEQQQQHPLCEILEELGEDKAFFSRLNLTTSVGAVRIPLNSVQCQHYSRGSEVEWETSDLTGSSSWSSSYTVHLENAQEETRRPIVSFCLVDGRNRPT